MRKENIPNIDLILEVECPCGFVLMNNGTKINMDCADSFTIHWKCPICLSESSLFVEQSFTLPNREG